jgi:hypothetical protein
MILAIVGAVLGARVGRKAGERLGAAVERGIAEMSAQHGTMVEADHRQRAGGYRRRSERP